LLNSPQRCSKLKSTAFIDENHNFPSRIDVKTGNLSHPKLFEPLKKYQAFVREFPGAALTPTSGVTPGTGVFEPWLQELWKQPTAQAS
jgi:hypothetical protein